MSEAKSRVNISATVDALGLTGIGMKYVGDTPVYLSGSIYLAFPAATAASGPCRLPGGYEEFLAQLPSAWLHYPEGANPITVWPADFLLEVFGNKVCLASNLPFCRR